MTMTNMIDIETVRKYELETGKQWTESEEHMAEICYFYEYAFVWNEKGNITVISNLNKETYKYDSAADMVKDWVFLCKETNKDYIENGMNAPFKWCCQNYKNMKKEGMTI